MKQLLILAATLLIATSAQSPVDTVDDAVASRSTIPDISAELKLPKVFTRDLGTMLAMSDFSDAGQQRNMAG
jgi:hypothetical protein